MQPYIFDITLFGIQITPTWYGLMYALGFIICYQFMKKWSKLGPKELDSLLLYVFFGVIVGGRIGYVLLYNPLYFLEHPLDIMRIWEGGMSFHGGFLGVIVALFLFSRSFQKSFFSITDTLAVIIPIALGLGRMGNWINGELPGFSPYDGPFAMIKDGIAYFPSPLLEGFLEGIALFFIMISSAYMLSFFREGAEKIEKKGILSALFLIGYATMRLISEHFRLPDTHIGYIFGSDWITLGIVYTLPMLLGGIFLLVRKYIR